MRRGKTKDIVNKIDALGASAGKPFNSETSIAEARVARARECEEVAVHLRRILSRLNFLSQSVTRRLDGDQSCHGPIPDLRLPRHAWKALRNTDIGTLHELVAVAHRIERFDGIGVKTAQAIRAELDRVAGKRDKNRS